MGQELTDRGRDQEVELRKEARDSEARQRRAHRGDNFVCFVAVHECEVPQCSELADGGGNPGIIKTSGISYAMLVVQTERFKRRRV